jgi:hypothetical protein
MTKKFRFRALMTPGCISDPIKYTFLKSAQNFTSNQAQKHKNW